MQIQAISSRQPSVWSIGNNICFDSFVSFGSFVSNTSNKMIVVIENNVSISIKLSEMLVYFYSKTENKKK